MIGHPDLTQDLADSLDISQIDYAQQVWQQQLLSELGVTRWVPQSAMVVAVDNIRVDAPVALEDNHLSLVTTAQPPIDEQHVEPPAPTAIQPASLEQFNSEVMDNAVTLNALNAYWSDVEPRDEVAIHPASPLVMVKRFRIQAMVAGDWLLLVDEAALQQDSRQQTLWQNIATALQATVHYYMFPLLDTVDKLPISAQHMMSNVNMAMAAFEGFVFAVTQGKGRAMGNVTCLPSYFDTIEITPLPTLAQMLQDPQSKRKFWQMIQSRTV